MGLMKKKNNTKKTSQKKIAVEDLNQKLFEDNKAEETKIEQEVKEDKKPKTIKKNTKVVVTGRLYGSSKKEAPMNFVKDYSAKVIDIDKENKMLKTENGWISFDSVK